MKTSTLMTAALVSASCFAAPSRTAPDTVQRADGPIPAAATQPDLRDVPVAPPAPGVPAAIDPGPAHWRYLKLPKSRRLDETTRADARPRT